MAQLKPSDYVVLNAPAYYLEEQCGHTLPERESPCVLFREDTEFLAEAYLERYLFPRLHGSSSHLPDPVALETASSADPDNLVLGFKNAHPSVASVVAPVADLLGPSRFFVPSSRIFFSREVNGANMSDSCLAGLWSLLQDSPGDAYVSSDLAYVSTDVFSFPSSYGTPWYTPDLTMWLDADKTSTEGPPTRMEWSGDTPLPPVATIRDKAAYSWFASSSAAADAYATISSVECYWKSSFTGAGHFCVPDSSLAAGRGVFDGTGLELARDGKTLFGIDSGSTYPGDFPLLLWRLPAWYHGLLAHPPAGADSSLLDSGRGMLSRTCTRPGAVSLYGILEDWGCDYAYENVRTGKSRGYVDCSGGLGSSESNGELSDYRQVSVIGYLPSHKNDGSGQAYFGVTVNGTETYEASEDAPGGDFDSQASIGSSGRSTVSRGKLYLGTASDPYPAKALRGHVSSVRVLLPFSFACHVYSRASSPANVIDEAWVARHPDAPSSVKEHIYTQNWSSAGYECGEFVRCGIVAFPASYDADSGRWYVDGAGVSRFMSSVCPEVPSFVDDMLGSEPTPAGQSTIFTTWDTPSLSSMVSAMAVMRTRCGVSTASSGGDGFVYHWAYHNYDTGAVYGDVSASDHVMYARTAVSLSRAMVLVDWDFPATPPDSWVWTKPVS